VTPILINYFATLAIFVEGYFTTGNCRPNIFFHLENVGLENSKKSDFEIRKNQIQKFEKNVWATFLVGKGFSTEMVFVAK